MPHVTVRINNRLYEIACAEGEEERLLALAGDVDACVLDLRRQIAGAPEIKLMVLGALTMADKVREAEIEAAHARAELQTLREELASTRAEATRKQAVEPQSRLEDLFSGFESRIEGLARKVAAA